MKKKLVFLSVLLGLFLVCAMSLASGEVVPFTQTWEAVDGASGYRVEIQNSKSRTVVSKDVAETSLDLELPIGQYQIRISSLNIFGAAETSTDWVKFVVRKIETPVIQKTEPHHAQEDIPFTLRIRATGIDEKTKWRLIKADNAGNGKAVSSLSVSFEGMDYCDVRFPGIGQGLYSLEAIGRTGKTGDAASVIFITENDPIVSGTAPHKTEPQTPFSLEIKGKYLNLVEKVELVPDGETRESVKASLAVERDDTKCKAGFPALRPGSYTLVVTALNSQKLMIEHALQVLMPKPELKSIQVFESRRQIVIEGSEWTSDMQAFLSQGSSRQAIRVIGQTDTGLVASYPETLVPGTYDLIVSNNQGKETLSSAAVKISTAFSLSMQRLNEEEFQPITVTLFASARTDDKLGWSLNGADRTGNKQSVSALSATWDPELFAWRVQFPGMPQGVYHIQASGVSAGVVDFPNEITVSDHTPLLSRMIPEKAETQQPFACEVWGEYLKADGKLEFVSEKDGQAYPFEATVSAGNTRAEGLIAGLPTGSYALKAISPQGKACVRSAALYVQIPLPVVQSFAQHPWDADKKLLKTAVTGSKLSFVDKVFLTSKDGRTQIQIDQSSDKLLVVAYPVESACGTYDLVLATADGRETVISGGVEIRAPAKLSVGSVLHSCCEPLILRMNAPGVDADGRWLLVGNNAAGKFLSFKPDGVKDEGNNVWSVSFKALPEGSYHLSVTRSDGKKQIFPGVIEMTDPAKLPGSPGSGQ